MFFNSEFYFIDVLCIYLRSLRRTSLHLRHLHPATSHNMFDTTPTVGLYRFTQLTHFRRHEMRGTISTSTKAFFVKLTGELDKILN
jgi:hypothetical protein